MNTYLPNRKRNLMLLFFLLMGFAGLTKGYAYSFSAVCPSGQTLYYNITDETNHYVELTCPNGYNWSGFTKPTGDLVIPDFVEHYNTLYSVTNIGYYAFNQCDGLTSVSFPNTLVTIGGYGAFHECTGLTSLTFPNSLTTIGNSVFEFCSNLTSVSLPNSLITIDDCAFNQCDLTSVVIPNSVTSIGNCSFYKLYHLTSITIGSSVSSIGPNAFRYCTRLASLSVLAEEPPVLSDNAFGDVPKNIPVSVPCSTLEDYQASVGWNEFTNYQYQGNCPIIFADANVKALCIANWDSNSDGELSYAEAAQVSSIGTVFQGKTTITSFDELQYFTGLTSLVNSAFRGCNNLISIVIPNSVTTIEKKVFMSCSSLVSIVIPNSVTSVGEQAFYYCSSLTSVALSNSLSTIANSMFQGCSGLLSITIPNSVTTIGSSAFRGCNSLISIEIPDHVTNISYYAFSHCSSLSTINIPNSVVSIGDRAFEGCGFSSIVIPNSLTALADDVFASCSNLTSITIPNSIISIGVGSFLGCTSLTTITIPNSVSSIGSSAFSGCSNLISIAIPDSINTLGLSLFYNCSSLTSISIPYTVTSIGSFAFSGCSSLASITVLSDTPPSLGTSGYNSQCFSEVPKNIPVYVPCESVALYQATNGWDEFTNYHGLYCPNHFIEALANPTSAGTVTGAGTYNHEESATLIATASDGFTFFNWTENDEEVSTDAIYTFTVTGDRTLVANFSLNSYSITVTANPSEAGALTGTGTYDYGSTATLTATPNEGYIFVNWTENGEEVSTEATYSFTVTGDRTLVANFSQNSCHWTPVTGMSGSMTMLAILKIDGVQSFADNMEIGAFSGQECRGTALPQYYQEYCFYSLNIVGNTDGDPITFRLYDHHLNQELDLYCSNELNFVDGEAYGFDNFYEINFFNLVQITAMADPAEGGSTNGSGSYYNLSTCTLVAVANEGYSFQYWTLNDEVVSSDATYSFEVNGAADYVAHFSLNSYEISVTAQPTEGGSVSGNGTYNHFAICTLTAEANTGYSFESWTLNGEVVSNEPIYNFEVSSAANYVANFSPNNYEIVAIANPSNGGTIEGTGTYNHFQTCTLTATANEGYQFNSWIMDGVIVSTETTYSFVVSGPVTITAMFDVMQTVVLSQGWTWWGSSVELSSLGQDGGLSMLEESMNPNGRVIKTIDKFVHYQVKLGQWIGGLNRLTNEESYRIQTITPCTVSFTGPAAHPENHPIHIQQYWNWIGYPVSQPQTVATALGNYQPSVNDVIKGQGGYATYLPDVGWMPQYFTLNPGQSYMYYSVNSENQTLVYANGRGDVPVAEPDHRHWRNDIHAFADNLCLMAVVTVDGVEQRSEELELGAFVNGECRGSARLLYIEPLDRYYAMMTVSGQDNEVVEFALIDMSHHQISTSSTTRLTFINDAICGTYDNPYTVAFGTMAAIEEHTSSMYLYPNPINRFDTFNLVIPEDEEIVELTVVDAFGAVVRRETGAIKRHAVPGLSVTGLYMVHVVCKSGNVYHGRLMVD